MPEDADTIEGVEVEERRIPMIFKVIRIHRIDGEGNLKAFVDIALDECLLLKGLRVVEGRSGLFVSMPREKGRDNRWYETVHPMDKETKDALTEVVLGAYEQR